MHSSLGLQFRQIQQKELHSQHLVVILPDGKPQVVQCSSAHKVQMQQYAVQCLKLDVTTRVHAEAERNTNSVVDVSGP